MDGLQALVHTSAGERVEYTAMIANSGSAANSAM